MRLARLSLAAVLLFVASGASFADGGGCLQGTWTYHDDNGAYVGHEVFGCGADDGQWGSVTPNRSFTPGCISPI